MGCLIIKFKATEVQIKEMSQEFGDYVKIVVDIKRGILAGGGRLHSDCEKLLLEDGSRQEDLWGGGIDLKTYDIDLSAICNIKPKQENPSQEILDSDIRKEFLEITKRFLK